MSDISLYIHIPFCKSKCLYCDFLSYSGREEYMDRYVKALVNEIKAFKTNARVKTVFIGGGTPSVIPSAYIEQVMEAVFTAFNVGQGAEITMEANPGTVTRDSLRVYKTCGINRLSFGLQAWQDKLLKAIGRIHTCKDFVDCYRWAREAGFDNINCDLMFSLPYQTPKDYYETIERVTALEPEHISAYSLIVEEGTPFYTLYEEGRLPEIDENTDREMYWGGVELLEKKGYHQYEISNLAKAGRECAHNMVYWRRGEYKGFGLGAASLINEVRLKNTENMYEYIAGVTVTERESLSFTDRQEEFMFLGLRCNRGISATEFKNTFGVDIDTVYGREIAGLVSEGLIKRQGSTITLTKRGFDLANRVFVEFIH